MTFLFDASHRDQEIDNSVILLIFESRIYRIFMLKIIDQFYMLIIYDYSLTMDVFVLRLKRQTYRY